MPADDQSLPRGEPGAVQDASSQQSPPTNVPPPRLPFTFINQHGDEKSLADKKIVNTKERHAIRSHVMKTVRHSEMLAGKKRPTGREKGRKASEASAVTTSNSAGDSSASPSTFGIVRGSSTLFKATEEVKKQLEHMSPTNTTKQHASPAHINHTKIVESLEQYCRTVFIPMTFPVENNSEEELTLRWEKVMESKHQNSAVFYGMMTTVAAHRVITTGKVKDLTPTDQDNNDAFVDVSYSTMRGAAVKATLDRVVQMQAIDVKCVEAIFSLIGAASIMGNFEEARLHLRSIKAVLQYDSDLVDLQSPHSHWIPTTDVKAGVAMMTRPYFRLPWIARPIPVGLLKKITPPENAPLRRLGSAFWLFSDLSIAIEETLQAAVHLCWFSQFSYEFGQFLDATDHEILRRKTTELEYNLVTYVFDEPAADGDQPPNELVLSPLEQMVRLAVLAMISNTVTRILPAAGVGRALTSHQMKATHRYFMSRPKPTGNEAALMVWIMLQYSQGAAGQPEEGFFQDNIANSCRQLQINRWPQIEQVVYKYLWMPAQQEEVWKKIWMAVIDLGPASSDASRPSTASPASAT